MIQHLILQRVRRLHSRIELTDRYTRLRLLAEEKVLGGREMVGVEG